MEVPFQSVSLLERETGVCVCGGGAEVVVDGQRRKDGQTHRQTQRQTG